MHTHVDVIIIGTGTAALAAAGEVKKVTDQFLIISNGIYGTTCVLAGCMPSKAFIQGAQLYHSRKRLARWGISGVEDLQVDTAALLAEVRALREQFLKHTLQTTEEYRPHIIEGDAWFLSPSEIRINDKIYTAKGIVLATGSSPIIPDICTNYTGDILTTDTLFEQDKLPKLLSVIGLSVLGAEMAQAFARLGIQVTASHENEFIGGLSDPKVNDYALKHLREEMDIHLSQTPEHCVKAAGNMPIFIAQSRKANLDHMGLEQCGIIKPDNPIINYDPETMQVGDLPVFVAGDVKLGRSILNEASDEGKIAGYNASREKIKSFRRRTPLQIIYTDPTIAIAGKAWGEIDPETIMIGEVAYDDQGRAKIMGEANGIIRIYADKKSEELLGAELFAPAGEHLAHLLAWLINQRITVSQALELPFYHPSLEEGIRTALENTTTG
jgi:dihydrolipoamide dehydrogenase